jgi:hypothetical protein
VPCSITSAVCPAVSIIPHKILTRTLLLVVIHIIHPCLPEASRKITSICSRSSSQPTRPGSGNSKRSCSPCVFAAKTSRDNCSCGDRTRKKEHVESQYCCYVEFSLSLFLAFVGCAALVLCTTPQPCCNKLSPPLFSLFLLLLLLLPP